MENTITNSDRSSNELTVPASGDLIGNVSIFVRYTTKDLIRISAAPSSGFEGQDTGVLSPVINDLCIMHDSVNRKQ